MMLQLWLLAMVIQLPNWSAGITGRIYHTGKGLLALPSAVVSGSWYGSSWSLEMLPSARCEGTGTLAGRDSYDDDSASWGAWGFLMHTLQVSCVWLFSCSACAEFPGAGFLPLAVTELPVHSADTRKGLKQPVGRAARGLFSDRTVYHLTRLRLCAALLYNACGSDCFPWPLGKCRRQLGHRHDPLPAVEIKS